jgi:hypothetical protein
VEVSPQAQTLDDIMQAHGGTASTPSASDPLDAIMAQHGGTVETPFSRRGGMTDPAMVTPDFTTTNEPPTAAQYAAAETPADRMKVIRQTPVGQDLDAIKTFVGHVGHGINPLNIMAMVGHVLTTDPRETVQAIGAQQGALYDKAVASAKQGDYVTAGRHFLNYLLPFVGPVMDQASDDMQGGKYAAASGDSVALGLSLFGPQALTRIAKTRYPLAANPTPVRAAAAVAERLTPEEAASNAFATERGVPLDASTATGSKVALAAQKRVANSMGGETTATRLIRDQQTALSRVGADLADEAHPTVVTAEQAGQGVRDALATKVTGHHDAATTAYDTLREMEADPTNRMQMAVKPDPVGALQPWQADELRRMVHELDASGFTTRQLEPTKYGGSLQHVEGTGGAGAQVFDDIMQRSGSPATRGVLQSQLETFLGGGPETQNVRAALEVAKERLKGSSKVSKPELPPSAMSIPTRLEAARVTSEEMGLPVDLTGAKQALRPLYDQMTRQLPITQQQANPGLKALSNILDGPDTAPLSQVDRDLSAIKSLARSQGGLAKMAVAKLSVAVDQAAANGGPTVTAALREGRQATIGKHATLALLDQLRDEPVKVFKQLTAPQDSAIHLLRQIKEAAPGETQTIARGYLEDALSTAMERGRFDHADKLYADWQRLGTETKKILFPQPGQTQALDHFFLLAKRLQENPNPSGTAHTLTVLNFSGQPVMYGLSKLLYTRAGVNALTRLLAEDLRAPSLPTVGPRATRTAALLEVAHAARSAGVPMALPAAADQLPPGATK